MTVMRVVKMSIHKIINVIAVRDRWVAAIGTMHMVFCMPGACMPAGAAGRIVSGDFQGMFFDDPVCVLVMQMAIVQVIDMVSVLNGCVATVGTVNMVMVCVLMRHGRNLLFLILKRLEIILLCRSLAIRLATVGKSVGDQLSHMVIR